MRVELITALVLAVAAGCGSDAAAPEPAPEEPPAPPPDETPPTVVASANDRGEARASIFMECTASDDVGVVRVDIYAQDGSLLNVCPARLSEPRWWCSWSWSEIPAPDGPYTFTCRAYDAAGHVSTATGGFLVFHTAPSPPALVGTWEFVVALSAPIPAGVDPTCSGELYLTTHESYFSGCLVGSDGNRTWGNIQRIDLDDAGNLTMAFKEHPFTGERQFTMTGTLETANTVSGAVTGGPFLGERFTATRRH